MGDGRTLITLEDSSAHLVDVDEKLLGGGVSNTSSFGLKTSVVNSLNIIVSFRIITELTANNKIRLTQNIIKSKYF